MPFLNLPYRVGTFQFHLETKYQLITRSYNAHHSPTSAILSTLKCQVPPNSSHVDHQSFLKYTKLFFFFFFAMGPTALASSLPSSHKPTSPCPSQSCGSLSCFRCLCPKRVALLFQVTALCISPIVLTDLSENLLHQGRQLTVWFSFLSQSPNRTGRSVCQLVSGPPALLPPLSTFSSALWRESLELCFPEDCFLNNSRLNSSSGGTYVRFKRQKKRRNHYSPVQLQTVCSDHRELFSLNFWVSNNPEKK